MYRAIATLSIFLVVLTFFGCGKNPTAKTPAVKSSVSIPKLKTPTSKIKTPAKLTYLRSKTRFLRLPPSPKLRIVWRNRVFLAKSYPSTPQNLPLGKTVGNKSAPLISKKPTSKPFSQEIPILMYHSIALNSKNNLLVPPAQFSAQIKHLQKAGYQTISFKTLAENWQAGKPLPPKPILLTFDDGYKDNYTTAYPILKTIKFQATIFVISNFVGDDNHISWKQIQEMLNSGLIEIGSHTKSHFDLTIISPKKRHEEIFDSRNIISKYTGKPVIAFAYPAGKYNYAVVKDTGVAGYKFAVTTKPGYAKAKQGLLTLHRVRINGNLSLRQFAKMFP